jgi:hypothetical protein
VLSRKEVMGEIMTIAILLIIVLDANNNSGLMMDEKHLYKERALALLYDGVDSV